jgi:alpha-tubulin suppressor-like RCC1 family protein
MAVACGDDFSVAVTEEGALFSFGENEYGQLGTGQLSGRAAIARNIVPTRVAGLPAPVRQVAAAGSHTSTVTEDGDLFMCGCGEWGQLGLGDMCNRHAPTLLHRSFFDNKAVLMVACGFAHTAIVTEDGSVYTFGNGEHGQLGRGDEENQYVPRRVPAAGFNGEQIVMVAAGDKHTAALSEAGHVFTWGFGEYGQLGHGNNENQLAPQKVEAGRFALEGESYGQREKIVFIAAGGFHTVAVTARGGLYTWGWNDFGQLGHGDTDSRLVPTLVRAGAFGAPEGGEVVMVSCGGDQTLMVTKDGSVWACGSGNEGQLGLNGTANRHEFERVQAGAFGDARVVAAVVGEFHSAAVTEDGALWTWGKGNLGQLGRGKEENHLVPVQVPKQTLGSNKIGRCRELPQDHQTAFAMGAHAKLCENSDLNELIDDLISTIVNFTISWPKGLTKQHEGLGRLLGAGLISLDKWPDFENIKKSVKTTLRACAKVCRPCTVGALAQNL